MAAAHTPPENYNTGEYPPSPPDSEGAEEDFVSDVPYLRRIHTTNGYRDGIAASKERDIQAGFDEGYSLGATTGSRCGYIVGVLEGMVRAVKKSKAESNAQAVTHLEAILKDARDCLSVQKVFSPDYFNEEGLWRFDVKSATGSEEDVTFPDVAAAHPLLSKWETEITRLAEQYNLDLQVLSHDTREDDI